LGQRSCAKWLSTLPPRDSAQEDAVLRQHRGGLIGSLGAPEVLQPHVLLEVHPSNRTMEGRAEVMEHVLRNTLEAVQALGKADHEHAGLHLLGQQKSRRLVIRQENEAFQSKDTGMLKRLQAGQMVCLALAPASVLHPRLKHVCC